jgi:hypothetical protein
MSHMNPHCIPQELVLCVHRWYTQGRGLCRADGACARHIRGLCKTHQRFVQDTSEVCARHIRGLCMTHQRSKQSPTMGHVQGRGLCMMTCQVSVCVRQHTVHARNAQAVAQERLRAGYVQGMHRNTALNKETGCAKKRAAANQPLKPAGTGKRLLKAQTGMHHLPAVQTARNSFQGISF